MWLLQSNTYEITYISAGEKLRSLSRNLHDKKNINLYTFQIAAIIAGIIYMDNNTYIRCPILRCDYTLIYFLDLPNIKEQLYNRWYHFSHIRLWRLLRSDWDAQRDSGGSRFATSKIYSLDILF